MIIHPFGPLIYKESISGDFHQFLLDAAEASRIDPENVGYSLAGNIEDQLLLKLDPEKFVSYIYPHVFDYMNSCMEHQSKVALLTDAVLATNFEHISFDLGSGPWINYQRKNEFNPVHSHNGNLSSVIFIDIPEEIREEAKHTVQTNMPCPGQLEFMHGNDGYNYSGTFKVVPQTAQIYLFPADLKHTVYPFTSDVERITMSFNVFNIETQ
tara:strand:+ start:4974 stop:5606 length:633 start_codon:yes stop_codon:yes gene_type:complete